MLQPQVPDNDKSVFSKETRRQNTVANPVSFAGRGLFHGHDVTMKLLPADSGHGIVFRRVDLPGSPDIPACCQSIAKVPRRTVLTSAEGVAVETVEHLMAALAGLNVDNCLIEIDAHEVPAYDGSCRDFCDGILDTGLQVLDESITVLQVSRVATVDDGKGQTLSIEPSDKSCTTVEYDLDYGPGSPIFPQSLTAEITPNWFYEHISAARTFVLESEITALKQMGYGRHLTAKDIVVLGKQGVIDNELRWPDEGVRHKILDCVGDLALCGAVFRGHVRATRSGHHLNHELARKLTIMRTGRSVSDGQAA